MTTDTAPIAHNENAVDLINALRNVHIKMTEQGLNKQLSALLELRASQINQCAYCVNMHLEDAKRAGVNQEKLDLLIVWRQVDVFSAAERAVFAWTEALTLLNENTDYASLRAGLRQHFSDSEITVLTANIGMINLWNRARVSNH